MAKLSREIPLFRQAFCWSASVILVGMAVLELLFREH
jgi:hypothetical protein